MSVQVPLFEKGDKKPSKVATKVEEIVGEGFDVAKFVENFEVLAEASGTVPKLRQLIRTLAVSGRLTKQRSGEDARELLTALKTANAGTVRKKLPGDDEEIDAPAQLPGNWCWARFLDVASIDSNLVDPAKFLDAPHVAPDNIEKGTGRLIEYRTVREDGVTSNKHRFFPRQIVYSKIRPNLSKVVVVDFEGVCSADMYPITSRIDRAYLHQFMLSQVFLDQVVKEDNRLAMPKVNQEQLGSTLVAVPPLAEQKRIVAKVDQLMALCDELEAKQTKKRETGARLTKSALDALTSAEGPDEFDAAWNRVVENFDVLIDRAEKVGELRRTVLELAVRGRLVAHSTSSVEIEALLATVAKQRHSLLEGKRKGGRGHGDDDHTESCQQDPYEVPTGWRWCTLRDVAGHIVDGTHHTPRYVERGMDFISAKDIRNGRVTFEGCKQISREEFEDLTKRCRPKRGDVLVTKSGSIGEVALVETDRQFTLFESVAMVPVVQAVNSQYVAYVVYLGATGQFGAEKQRGVAVRHLHLVDLRKLPFPLPPRAEQDRIVAKVEHMMKICDLLEERLRQAEDRASKLVEAVVRELVA
ncbi:MAG: restriction endonuclease subunit S [Myxococcales bacterium]|nr:restriction endonuclease subunit S [Myxococcales bacterium]